MGFRYVLLSRKSPGQSRRPGPPLRSRSTRGLLPTPGVWPQRSQQAPSSSSSSSLCQPSPTRPQPPTAPQCLDQRRAQPPRLSKTPSGTWQLRCGSQHRSCCGSALPCAGGMEHLGLQMPFRGKHCGIVHLHCIRCHLDFSCEFAACPNLSCLARHAQWRHE